jgi:hypothetical protein
MLQCIHFQFQVKYSSKYYNKRMPDLEELTQEEKARGRMTPTSGFVLLSLPTNHPPAKGFLVG